MFFFLTAKVTQSLDTTEEILVTCFVCLVVIVVMVKQSRAELVVEQNGRSSSKRGDGGTVGSTMMVVALCL